MAVHTDKKRRKVFEKTDGHCAYCGVELEFESPDWCPEHLLARVHGGGDRLHNLVPACIPCNRRKHVRTPEGWREHIKIKILQCVTEARELLRVYTDDVEAVQLLADVRNAAARCTVGFAYEDVLKEADNG